MKKIIKVFPLLLIIILFGFLFKSYKTEAFYFWPDLYLDVLNSHNYYHGSSYWDSYNIYPSYYRSYNPYQYNYYPNTYNRHSNYNNYYNYYPKYTYCNSYFGC